MAGSAINWESLAREDAIGPIVSSGRYRLDSPSTVTGSPTFAMGATGQTAEIRVFLPGGKSIEAPLAISGTTAVSLVDQVGKPFSQSDLALIEIEVVMPYGQNLLTTDEPNGSPSAPFATEAQRTAWATANLASLLPGRTTAWGPGNVESVWNGPLATDWQGIRGPYLGSAENPFSSYEALVAAPSASWEMPWVVNPLAPEGKTQAWLRSDQGIWVPRPGQCIAQYRGPDGAPILDTTGAGRTLGVWLGVWSGAPLADWLLPNYGNIMIGGSAEMSDPSSTATQKLRVALRGEHLLTGNEWDAMLGSGGATSTNTRGLGGVLVTERRFGGVFRGVAGNGAWSGSSAGQTAVTGAFVAGSTAPYFEAFFGATTNILRLFTINIWSAA